MNATRNYIKQIMALLKAPARAAYLCRYISLSIVTVHGKSGREYGKHINIA